MKKRYSQPFLFFLISMLIQISLLAQSYDNPEDVKKLRSEILHLDSLFWKAYNTCDLDSFETFLTEDLEFYHDKGGLTTTLATLMESAKNGRCSNENWRLRREVIEGSLNVYPLNNYGAILSGDHVFYIIENGEERLDGKAKFTHVWQLKDNKWKMSRVLSYDHRPAYQKVEKNQISLADDVLISYVGQYEGPQTGVINVSKKDGNLEIQSGPMRNSIYPESENLFFHNERDLTFEFTKDSNGKVSKMVVREHGKIVEEAKRLSD